MNEADAQVIRRIFEMYASGYSLKAIAKTLNAEKVPIAEQGHSSFLLAAIAERENKLREITDPYQ